KLLCRCCSRIAAQYSRLLCCSIVPPMKKLLWQMTSLFSMCGSLTAYDKSGANRAAVDSFNAGFTRYKPVTIRQNKYLNNHIEQDHCNIKRRIRSMLGFKTFRSAQILLSEIELIAMFRKGQFVLSRNCTLSPSEPFFLMGFK
ncbi:MAG: DDE-type integrase/transposase/recombinase, partial [Providencia rustigianii]|uniref:DDE-type integrase/transposase/recombinase n=1 Tax=Providencia rustigianii TaxID=158850 RepID=UPI003F34E69F